MGRGQTDSVVKPTDLRTGKRAGAASLRQRRIAPAVGLAFALGAGAAALPALAACPPSPITTSVSIPGCDNLGLLDIQAPGGTLTNTGLLRNGTLADHAGATLSNAGTLNNHDRLRNYGSLSNAGTLNNYFRLNNFGSLSNAGTLNNYFRLNNFGSLSNAGTLNNNSLLRNFGSLSNAGTLNSNGALLNLGSLSNAGTLNSNGALLNLGSLSNAGNLVNAGLIANRGQITNTGSFSVTPAGSVTGTGSFTQTAGTTQVDGTLAQSFIDIAGGVLKATGTVTSANTILIGAGATVAPGDSPGMLTLSGNVDFAGELEVDLASATSFDQLRVLGALNFQPTAHINFLLGFGLSNTTYSFHFLDSFGGLSGWSSSMYDITGSYAGYTSNLMCTSGGCDLNLTFTTAPIPEPETYALLLAGLGFLGYAARRRRQESVTAGM